MVNGPFDLQSMLAVLESLGSLFQTSLTKGIKLTKEKVVFLQANCTFLSLKLAVKKG